MLRRADGARGEATAPSHQEEEANMGQLYLQRFEYMGPVSKADFEQTWGEALQAFARTGNWGAWTRE